MGQRRNDKDADKLRDKEVSLKEMQNTEKSIKTQEEQTASEGGKGEKEIILLRPGTMIFRAIAGAYLLYLAYNLLKGFSAAGSGERWMIVIAAVIFLAVALWLLITTGKKFLYGEYKGGTKDPEAGNK